MALERFTPQQVASAIEFVKANASNPATVVRRSAELGLTSEETAALIQRAGFGGVDVGTVNQFAQANGIAFTQGAPNTPTVLSPLSGITPWSQRSESDIAASAQRMGYRQESTDDGRTYWVDAEGQRYRDNPLSNDMLANDRDYRSQLSQHGYDAWNYSQWADANGMSQQQAVEYIYGPGSRIEQFGNDQVVKAALPVDQWRKPDMSNFNDGLVESFADRGGPVALGAAAFGAPQMLNSMAGGLGTGTAEGAAWGVNPAMAPVADAVPIMNAGQTIYGSAGLFQGAGTAAAAAGGGGLASMLSGVGSRGLLSTALGVGGAIAAGGVADALVGGAPSAPNFGGSQAGVTQATGGAASVVDADSTFRQQVYNDFRPRVEQMYTMANQIAQEELGMMRDNRARADQQWGFYNDYYRPNEMQVLLDAYGSQYLSNAENETVSRTLAGMGDDPLGRQIALGRVARVAEDRAAEQAMTKAVAMNNSAIAQQQRGLQRLGGDPNRMAAYSNQLQIAQAANSTNAANQARQGVRDRQLGLRQGVANFGRNFPNTAAQATGLATQSGNSAVANQGAGTMSGLPYAQYVSAGTGNQLAAQGLALQGQLGMEGLRNQAYNAQMNAYGQSMSGLGNFAGQVVSGAIPYIFG